MRDRWASVRALIFRCLLGAECAFLAGRMAWLVHRYAVDLLFMDQWDFYTPLFHHRGAWAAFDYEHAPHRQGIGMVMTRWVALASGWNTRWDGYLVWLTLLALMLVGLVLVRRCGGGGWACAAVPLAVFDVHQYEALVGTQNVSHGAMPALLLALYAWSHFLRAQWLRLACAAVLAFLMVFTGFGIFGGVLAALLAGVELARNCRTRRWAAPAAALIAMAATWWGYLHGYVFSASVPGFHFPFEHPLEYFPFMAVMAANAFGLAQTGFTWLAGGVFLLALTAVALASVWGLLKHGIEARSAAAAAFTLAAFDLMYIGSTAVGRIFVGMGGAVSSRYVTLMIPGLLAIVLGLLQVDWSVARRTLLPAFALWLAATTPFLTAVDRGWIAWFYNGKTRWKAAYLATHDEARADQIAHFTIYPVPLGNRLHFLEQRHLNLFSGRR